MLVTGTGQGTSAVRSPRSSSALAAKLAAFVANAHPYPAVWVSSPATEARRTWLRTAADQIPLLAATRSSSPTSAGSSDPAAGLKNTAPADRPNETAYTMTMSPCQTAKMAASTTRARSAAIMIVTRGSRSTSGPASGASTSTGTISAMTTPDTPSPDPVS